MPKLAPNALHDLVSKPNSLDALQKLINEHPDLDLNAAHTETEATPLQIAFMCGSLDAIQFFTETHKNRVSFKLSHTRYDLLSYAAHNSPEVRKYLAGNAEILKAQSGDISPFLHAAALAGQLDEVKRILADNPDAIKYGDPFGRTVLFWAAASGQHAIVAWLLQQPHFKDSNEPAKFDDMLRGYSFFNGKVARQVDHATAKIAETSLIAEHYETAIAASLSIVDKKPHDYLIISSHNVSLAHLYRLTDPKRAACLQQAMNALANVRDDYPLKSRNLRVVTEALNPSPEKLAEAESLARLDAEVAKWGFQAVDVPGDGDCFFYAIMNQMEHCGTQIDEDALHEDTSAIDIQLLRDCLADHISKYNDRYIDFLAMYEPPMSIWDYASNTRKMKSWADQITLSAFSRTFNVNVVVFSNTGAPPVIHRRPNPIDTFYFAHEVFENHELHFQSLHRVRDCTPTHSISDAIANTAIDDFEMTSKTKRKADKQPVRTDYASGSEESTQDAQAGAANPNKSLRRSSGTLFSETVVATHAGSIDPPPEPRPLSRPGSPHESR